MVLSQALSKHAFFKFVSSQHNDGLLETNIPFDEDLYAASSQYVESLT